MSMEKRKKTRELSEEVRHKIVAKHGQSQGHKSISRDLVVPVSTVRNVIRKFKAHGTGANLPGRGRKKKLDRRLQQMIVRMVEKAPRSTAQQIQADLQTQGTTVLTHTIRRQLNERGFYGRRHRMTPLLRGIRKPDWSLPKHTWTSKSFWENVLWTDETKLELCGKAHHLHVNMKPS